MGYRVPFTTETSCKSTCLPWGFPLAWQHRTLAALLLVSFALQPLMLSSAAPPMVPLSYFAPKQVAAPDPFVWISPRPSAPFIGGGRPAPADWARAWHGPARPAAPQAMQAAAPGPAAPWQPAGIDENAPLAPPDGIPVAPADGFPGPLPGINQAVGNSTITGEVSDAISLNPIAGAFVDVMGTGRTAQTDAKGRFTIGGLPAATFTLEASKLGYSTETSVITTLEGQPAEVRFGLRIKPADDIADETMLEEETIVGEYSEDSQGDLFLDLKATPNIASGIGKDDFSRSGIGDAGDAVSKISGANIVGGKYAVVRGLGDRYSNTLVNGASISSADPTKKAVQLDLFPSDLLESISIYKTFVPELPAEFAGGTVFIKTLQFPDKPIVKVEYGRKTNSQLSGDFYGSGTDLGYFGQVNDSLPSAVPSLESREWTAGTTGPRPPTATNPIALKAIEQATAIHLSSDLRPSKRDSKIPESFAVTLGNTFKLGNNLELGVVLAGTSANGDEARRDITVGRSLNSGTDGITGSEDDFLNRTQTEDRYTSTAGYGVLGSFGLRAGERHQINFTAFQNYQAENEVTRARKIRDDTSGSGEFAPYAGPGSLPTGQLTATPFGATAAAFQALDNITPLRRELTLLQTGGHHEFGDEDNAIELDWLHSSNQATEERPATRTAFFSELDFTDPSIATNVTGAVLNPSLGRVFTQSDIFGINPALSQSFRETLSTEEESTNSRIDLTIPVWEDDDNAIKIKVGGNQFDRSREVRGRFFTYNIGQVLNGRLAEEDDGQLGIDFLEGINGTLDPNGVPFFNGHASSNRSNGIYIEENTTTGNTVRNVDAGTDLAAGYFQANVALGKWDITGGFRYESENRSFEVLEQLNPPGTTVPFTTVSNDYLLPGISINRTFGVDDQFTSTFAWSRTVARPTFFEFAPIRTVDQASGDTFQGNSSLTDTLIENYDLRWAWNPGPESMLALSLFHKSLNAPIAQTFGLGERTFVNGTNGSLQGIEIELQKQFLTNWSITSNFTFIDSVLEFIQQPDQLVSSTFDGQPSYIYNLILGWNHEESGWGATLNYNFTGSYLTSVPSSAVEPPVRRNAYNQIDLIVQKRFELEHGVGIVTLNIGNLLNEADTESFDGTDLIYRSFRPGRTYGLKFEYQF